MAKGKTTVFFCQNCGHEENKWLGQCPACKEWNTFVEEEVVTGSSAKTRSQASAGRTSRPVTLREVTRDQEERAGGGQKRGAGAAGARPGLE